MPADTVYTYTPANRVDTITAPGGRVWNYDYTALGTPDFYTHPNGMKTQYLYETGKRNRLEGIQHLDGTGAAVEWFDWDLDAVGNITGMTHLDGSVWDYVYDKRYRLTDAFRSNRAVDPSTVATYSYGYDGRDNLTSKTAPFEDDFGDGVVDRWIIAGASWSAAEGYAKNATGSSSMLYLNNVTDDSIVMRFSYYAEDRHTYQRTKCGSAKLRIRQSVLFHDRLGLSETYSYGQPFMHTSRMLISGSQRIQSRKEWVPFLLPPQTKYIRYSRSMQVT